MATQPVHPKSATDFLKFLSHPRPIFRQPPSTIEAAVVMNLNKSRYESESKTIVAKSNARLCRRTQQPTPDTSSRRREIGPRTKPRATGTRAMTQREANLYGFSAFRESDDQGTQRKQSINFRLHAA